MFCDICGNECKEYDLKDFYDGFSSKILYEENKNNVSVINLTFRIPTKDATSTLHDICIICYDTINDSLETHHKELDLSIRQLIEKKGNP